MKTFAIILTFAVLIARTGLTEAAGAPAANARVLFQSYDGDPTKPDSMTFQINSLFLPRKTEFLKLGERIAGSRLKLLKFSYKTKWNEKRQEDEDVSELTLVNVETGKTVVLTIGKPLNVPEVK